VKNIKILGIILLSLFVISSCVTKKKKGDQEVGKIKKFYHNVTAKYNGYWNANELMKKNIKVLNEMHQPDFSDVLEVYPYTDVENPAAVAGDMEIVMQKVAKVVRLHEPSHWVDDCYVMLGRAQFLKQDFETAEETFEYFNEEFDPNDPKSRLYNASKNKRKSKDEKQAERDRDKELRADKMKKAKREKEETKEDRTEAKKEKREKTDKYKKDIKKLKDDLRKATKKRKDDEKKARDKARKKKKRVKKDPDADPRSKKEIELETKLAAKEAEYEIFKTKPEEKEATAEDIASTEEKEEEKEEESKPKEKKKISDGGGLFKHKPAFHEGVYWLARTYIERDNYFSANFFLDKLLNEYPTSDDIRKEVPAAKAHLYLRQKEYAQAIPHLREAITVTGDKRLKARYAYIMGQVYQRLDQEAEAKASFAEVKKYKPDYSMEFNSKLNLAKSEWKSGQIARASVISRLEKMLKDKKNSDFKDQVHYTIGEIKEDDNDITGAVASYQASIRENTNNKAQKVESYHRIATLLYSREQYRPAKNYYDSTLTVMPKEDFRYLDVKKYASSLVEIAANIEIIELQDSLLMLSTLSPDQQREILADIAREQVAQAKEDPKQKTSAPRTKPNRGFGSSESSFFAYNATIVLTGKKLFQRKWGERNLTDHWRRSNRPGVIDDGEEESEEIAVEDLEEEAMNNLLRTIPMTPGQKEKVHSKRENALFSLGTAYRDKIQNYNKTVSSLETLLSDYPQTTHELDAMFYLYLAYLELGKTGLASSYKKKLSINYPDAKFTKSITDPNYVENLNKAVNKNDIFYSQTYDIFNEGNHLEVLARVDEAFQKLETTHPLLPKFALLQAMSTGSVNGKDAYITSLMSVISRYPNTTEETRAKEILRFLRGDSKAFNKSLYNEADEIFAVDDDKLHYVLIVLYSGSDQVLKDAEVKVSNYNKKYHKNEKLRISDIPLNQELGTQLMLVRKFKNKDKAMAYYNSTKGNSKDFIDPDKIGFDIFAATQKNYREIAKRKDVLEYRSFFEKNYLTKDKGK